MNKYWEVARTYWNRPGFWVLGAIYLILGGLLGLREIPFDRLSLSYLPLAAATCCFIALHLRRQFGMASAMVWPGFAGPHLALGAVASLLVCVLIPGGLAWWIGANLWTTIGLYSLAGMLLAAVVRWPKALGLLAAIPAVVVWIELNVSNQNSPVTRFLSGDDLAPFAVMFALSTVGQALAGIYLLQLATQSVTVSDDLLGEARLSGPTATRWGGLQLTQQDAAVERKLAHVGEWGWSIARWRIPVSIAWTQLVLSLLGAAALVAVVAYVTGDRAQAMLPLMIACSLFLVVPYSSWQSRRHAFGVEFMRPVAREQFWREMILAMICDVVMWTAVASVLAAGGCFALMGELPSSPEANEVWSFIAGFVAVLCGMACFLLGVALLTIRYRYWIPLILSLGLARGFFGLFFTVAMHVNGISKPGSTERDLFLFPLLSTGVGVYLTWCAYRHWREADVA